MKTAEQIFAQFEHLDGLAFTRAVNRYYREHDESNKWPICGRFNATERAIRQARTYRRDSGAGHGLEYVYLLDGSISDIVNDTRNW